MSAWLSATLFAAALLPGQTDRPPNQAAVPDPRHTAPWFDSESSRRPDVVLRWNEVLLQAVRCDQTAPPLAARNMAIVHAAVYDAVNSVLRTHEPFLLELQTLPGTL